MPNIIEQFKLYTQHKNLLTHAQDIFPTTQIYNNFKIQADKALQDGNLSHVQFALDTFELMQQHQSSPLFYDTLNFRLSDPTFSHFSDLVFNISPTYEQPQFVATKEITEQITTDLHGEDTMVISTPTSTQTAKLPTTNKTVLNIVNGIIRNSEVMYTADGIVTNRNAYTTDKIEELREEAYNQSISEAETPEDIEAVVNAFTPEQVSNFDTITESVSKPYQADMPNQTLEVSDTALELAQAILDTKHKIAAKNPNEAISTLTDIPAAEMLLE